MGKLEYPPAKQWSWTLPGFPRLVQVTSGGFSWWLWEARETGGGRGLSGLYWVWCIGRGPYLQLRQEPQGTSDCRLRSQGPCRLGTGESGLVLGCGMELRLSLEVSPGREATCRAVFGTWGFFRTIHGFSLQGEAKILLVKSWFLFPGLGG